jgi:hypothetical protein
MDTHAQKQIDWHFETLPRQTKKAFDFLSQAEWLRDSDWYLAGGTALALQVGNRKSVDLDFFTEKKDFDAERLLTHFLGNKDWKTTLREEGTIYGELFGAKVSFIAYPFFLPKQSPAQYGVLRILSPIDIAVMKIIAISQRGRKRDFFDLYWCAHHVEPIEATLRRLKVQYPTVAHDYNHILKSLVYFEDAESDPMPEISFPADWKKVKEFFLKEIPKITAEIIGLE